LQDSGRFGDIAEGAVSVVVVENILAAFEPGRAAGHHHALVQTRTRLRNWRGREIEINVIGYEQIELTVAVIVYESAAGIPPLARSRHPGLFAYVSKRAVAIVVVENVLAEISDEQVVETVVVVIADADALAPARMDQSGLGGHVGEAAVTIVFEQMRSRFLTGR